MKNKIFLAFAMFNSWISLHGQTVNDVLLDKIGLVAGEYIYVTVQEKLMKIELIVDIDYGQENMITRVLDDRGKNFTFYSKADVLNRMHAIGFELVEAELIPFDGDIKPISYFIMRKRKTEE